METAQISWLTMVVMPLFSSMKELSSKELMPRLETSLTPINLIIKNIKKSSRSLDTPSSMKIRKNGPRLPRDLLVFLKKQQLEFTDSIK